MDIRTAILKAADHIEANPGEFRFTSSQVPSGPGCGTPGCALGWTAIFMGKTDDQLFVHGRGFDGLLGVGAMDFYLRMDDLHGRWTESAADCAKALRLYADAFHPATEEYPAIRAELDRIANMQVERAGTG